MDEKIEDVSILFEKFLNKEVKENMQEKINNTLHEVYTGVFYPVIFISKVFYKQSEKIDAVRFIADRVNYLYSLNKIWKGFLGKALIIYNEKEESFTVVTYPLFFGDLTEKEEFDVILKQTPRNVLIKYGHIVKFRDGNYANYFENSLGKYFCHNECVCGLDIMKHYDENLLYLDRSKDFCDVVEIYKVDSSHFFESNFNSFKWTKGLWDKKLLEHKPFTFPKKSVDLIFKQMAAIADKAGGAF